LLQRRTGIKILDKIADATSMLAIMLRRPKVVAELLVSSVLQLVSMAVAFLVLAQTMHINVVPGFIFLLMPSIFFIASLPIFYLGWGAREAAVIFTIGATSPITTAEATGLSVAFGVAVFLAALPGAVFWALRPSMRKSIGQARSALEHADGS
jgi:cbb3-type cytochrome oxidase subunit 3